MMDMKQIETKEQGFTDKDKEAEELMQSQYLLKLTQKFISGLSEKEKNKLNSNIPKLKKMAFDLIRLVNAYAVKNGLCYYESLFIVDCFYRTVTWDAYKRNGDLKFLQMEKSEVKGYV
ncbi:MAG: hypothetical protein QMC80_09325 [Thermoplasmatales archaeon]|nr:hypothetical protein [Thermoplasmatales archaeon]